MNSNLVYFCLFHNKDYVDLLRILMITIKLYSQTDTIDFLVLTESKFESVIQDISSALNIPIRMKMCDALNNTRDSCYARYSIFEHEYIHNYQKILYLDTDIIVQNDLTILFDHNIEDRIYAIPEGSIQYEAWGGSFFDFTTIDKSTSGMNAGILFFKNTEFSRMLFKDITEHITVMKKFGCRMPCCTDQSFLNFHCIKRNRQDITLMNKYSYMYGNNSPSPPSSPTDVILCHYAWPIGNALHKKNRMLKHITHILNNYTHLLKDPKPFVVPNIIGNTYSWGNTTFRFIDNATFVTAWATYNYIWLDEFTIEANWSNYSHIFRFNSNYTNYICVRKDNLDYCKGSLDISSPAVKYSTKHPAPIKSMNSNLVYFCVFHNKDYVDLLRILMTTVKLYSQTDIIDFLVLTESKFESVIQDISSALNIPIHIKICNTLNKYDTYYSRYSIFDYEHINNYKKILYLDTDIIIQNDLRTLFNIDIEDRIHGMPELSNDNKHFTIESEWFGGWFFDFTTIDKNIKGMNSGILFFKNTESSRLIFKDITDHIVLMKKFGCRMPVPWDQPFLNFHCIKRDCYDTTLMNKYGFIYFRNSPPPPSSPTDIILCHYAGETESKKNKMLKHVLHLLNNYTNLLKDPKPFTVPNIIGNTYSWGNGKITFIDNTTIGASWAIYNYIWLDEFTLEANWYKYSNILRFNSDYTHYISVRKDNLDYGEGSLTTSTIDMNFLNELLKNKFTMVSIKRLINLYNKCELFNNTPYSFVECGVAKGGCLAVMKKLAGPNNKVFGFDSFEGMPAITPEDIGDYNKSNPLTGLGCVGDNLSGGVENVYKTFQASKLDMTNVHLVKGLFQDTLAQQGIIDTIGPIAVLRLDGDWYMSLKICLEALYDKVIDGGAIIIDDYGHFIGAKRAVDEFRQKRNIICPLIQTDYSEHYWIKTNDFENRNDMIMHYSNTIDKAKILEIGIFKGEFFDFIANNCPIGLLDGVDLFVGTNGSADQDGNNFIWYNLEQSFNELTEKYKTNPTVNLYKSDSSEYLQSKEDNYYDIIYIDGDHSYEGCKRDLVEAFKKIKHGGYIMGHDYEMNMKKAKTFRHFGVHQAVNEFCDTYKQIIIAKAMDGCVGFCIRIDKTPKI